MANLAAPPSWALKNVAALIRRPDLWRTAARLARRHAPNEWWKTKPYLPIPDSSWMEFRFETAFADVDGRPTSEQFIEYLEWAKSWRYL